MYKNNNSSIVFLSTFILILIVFTTIKPQFMSIYYSWIGSGDNLLTETILGNKSIVSKVIPLSIELDLSYKSLSILYSIIISFVSLVGLSLYGKVSKLNLAEICVFLGFLFLLDNLLIYESGMNYPLSIILVNSNTLGELGLAFSILSIASYRYNSAVGLVSLLVALLVHPAFGLITASYICLYFFLQKKYKYLIVPILITIVVIVIHYEDMSVGREYSLALDNIIGVHRREISFSDIKFLLIPFLLTILASNKKQFVIDWIFIAIFFLISILYYNFSIEFFRYEVLAIMPSKGVNLGVSIIIIKYYIDFIKNPDFNKVIAPLLLFIYLTALSLSNLFFFFFSCFLLLSCFCVFNLKKYYQLAFVILFISIVNIKLSYATPTQRNYDNFFKLNYGRLLNLSGDPNIMVRNPGVVEVLPMGFMNAYIHNPRVLIQANKVFYKVFNKNIWDLDPQKHKCGCISMNDVKDLSMNVTNPDLGIRIKYVLAPSQYDLNYEKAWVGDNGHGTSFTIYSVY
ncbi:hypothetical protein HN615_17710 [Candidatus Woesearchaeota archaeon]|nr:hypothetical protein [Candidatus Woesearchaeota archaeon]